MPKSTVPQCSGIVDSINKRVRDIRLVPARPEERFRLGSRRFNLPAAGVKNRLGVAVGYFSAIEDQVQSSLKGDALIKVRRQVMVIRIVAVLTVHDGSHSLQRLDDLLPFNYFMVQPVGHVLA